MKKRIIVASVVALAVTLGSSAFISGNVNAAEAVQKLTQHFGGKGGFSHSPLGVTELANADMAKLLGLTADELSTQLKAGKSLATIAGEKKIDVESVIAMETKIMTAALDQQLKDGKITQTQYDKLKTNLSSMAAKVVNGKAHGNKLGRVGHVGIHEDAALATLLGLTAEELETAVKSGKSLATIAAEKNISVQTVIDHVTKTLSAHLDEKLAEGTLTQEEVDKIKATLSTRATEIVNGTFKGKEGRGGRGHHRKANTDASASSTTTG